MFSLLCSAINKEQHENSLSKLSDNTDNSCYNMAGKPFCVTKNQHICTASKKMGYHDKGGKGVIYVHKNAKNHLSS